MLSFQEFVQSRRGPIGPAEQLQRSGSTGHASGHPLQQLDKLKQLARECSSAQPEQQPVQLLTKSPTYSKEVPAGSTGARAVPAHSINSPTAGVCAATAEQSCGDNSVTEASGSVGEPQQQQQTPLLGICCDKQVMSIPLLLSQDNTHYGRMHARQHTTTIVAGATAWNGTLGNATHIHNQPLLLRGTNEASGLPNKTGRLNPAVNLKSASTRTGRTQLQPMCLSDALLKPCNSTQEASNATKPVAAAVAHGSYSGPPTPSGRTYASRMQCKTQGVQLANVKLGCSTHSHPTARDSDQHLPSGAPGVSLQTATPITISKQPEHLQDHSIQQQWNGQRQQWLQEQPTEQQGPQSSQEGALQALQQQRPDIHQMVRSQYLRQQQKVLQHSHMGTASTDDSITERQPASQEQQERSAAVKQKLCLMQQHLASMKGKLGILRNGSKATGIASAHLGCSKSLQTSPASLAGVPSNIVQFNSKKADLYSTSTSMQQERGSGVCADQTVQAVPVLDCADAIEQQQADGHVVCAIPGSLEPNDTAAATAARTLEVTSCGVPKAETSQMHETIQQQYTLGDLTRCREDDNQVQTTGDEASTTEPTNSAYECPDTTVPDMDTDTSFDDATILNLHAAYKVPNEPGEDIQPARITSKQGGSYLRQLMSSKATVNPTDTELDPTAPRRQLQAICDTCPTTAEEQRAGVKKQKRGKMDKNLVTSDSHVLLVARQHARQLQQQNDALVRVLERERCHHKRVQQQVHDAQLELKECRAEYEVTLQVLQQENAALTAQLRKAMSTAGHQEVLDAYDTALAASAAKLQEAQTAAAALAAQLTDTELRLQQLQHVRMDSAVNTARGCFSDDDNDVNAANRLDRAAADAAVAAAALMSGVPGRSLSGPEHKQAADDTICSKGLRALRQQQQHLVQQLCKQQQEYSRLQRENIKLLRFKKQYSIVVSKLQDLTAVQEATATAAEEAGQRAAAAKEMSDKLQSEVKQMMQEKEHMHSVEQELRHQVQLCEQQLHELQHKLCWADAIAHVSPTSRICAGVQQSSVASIANSSTQGMGCVTSEHQHISSTSHQDTSQAATICHSPVSKTTEATVGATTRPDDHTTAHTQCSNTVGVSVGVGDKHLSTAGGLISNRQLKQSASAANKADDADATALSLVRQLSQLVTSDVLVQQHIGHLESAINAGIKQREALAAQGQMLLGLVVGS